MEGLCVWAVLLGLLGSGIASPVVDGKNPVAQLRSLASKLENLNENLETYVAAERQFHGDDGGTVDSNVPNETADDEALAQYMANLSPEDLALLKRMKNKLSYLKTAISQGQHGPNPGEEAPSVHGVKAAAAADTTEDDPEMAAFVQKLTPEEKEQLRKQSSRLKAALQYELKHPSHNPNPNEPAYVPVPRIMQKSVATEDAPEVDPVVVEYMQSLTPQQLASLMRHKSGLALLQKTLHEPQHGPNPGEETPAAVAESKQFPDPEAVEARLSAALIAADKAADKATEGTTDGAQDDPVIFTAADRHMLTAIQKKLDELMVALKTFKKDQLVAQHEEVKPATGHETPQHKTPAKKTPAKDGEFGEFVQMRSKRGPQSEWHDSPFEETVLGLVTKCANCDCDDPDCDCAKDCQPQVDAVRKSKKMMSSLNEAASKGINLKQLLNALSSVKKARERRFIDVEQELGELMGH